MIPDSLLEKLRKVMALHDRATTPGEREAAATAMRAIEARLANSVPESPPIEYRFTLADAWSRRLFVALARRHGLAPYRYRRQRHNTVMLRVTRAFVDQTLWPEYSALAETLRAWLAEATDRVIAQVFGEEAREAEVRDEAKALSAAG